MGEQMILPRGISGFFEKEDNFKSADTKIFKQMCYSIVAENNGKLLDMDISLKGKNFYVAEIQFYNKHSYLLMNAYYSYISFASYIGNNTINFIDKPKDLSFSFYEYTLLGLKELNADYQNSIEQLSNTELVQIKYWKPVTIGEIVFNFWD